MDKTLDRLANGQRVTFPTFGETISLELVRHEFQRTFYVLRYLRAAGLVLDLLWLGDE
jgi:hypothetical protein